MPDATPPSPSSASPGGTPLSRASRCVVSDAQVSAALDAEAVILSMHDGMYYGLDGVGARIWSMLQQPVTLGEISATIAEEFEVDEPQAFDDLIALVDDLERRALVSRVAGDG
ncbi:MAG: PqqD family protein [Gemmatimonadaceae bacterium]|nr:PqqD family protein [Gemmatimonadaceae bacterium]